MVKGKEYTTHATFYYLFLFNSLTITSQVALGLASIINRLYTVFPCTCVGALPADLLLSTINIMTDLTCTFLEAVAKEEEVGGISGHFLSTSFSPPLFPSHSLSFLKN